MAEQFTLKVCTPQGIFLEETVTEVTLPSSDGDMGVLPGHIDYTGLLGTGVMEFVSAGSQSPSRLVVSGGFVSFENDTLLILTDSSDDRDSVDRDSYAAERAELQKTVETEVLDTPQWQRAKTALDRVEAIDELISH